jgi:hypothetical protein
MITYGEAKNVGDVLTLIGSDRNGLSAAMRSRHIVRKEKTLSSAECLPSITNWSCAKLS